jgi:hypothetical protein
MLPVTASNTRPIGAIRLPYRFIVDLLVMTP